MLVRKHDRVFNLNERILADLNEARFHAEIMGNDFVVYLIAMAEVEISGLGSVDVVQPSAEEDQSLLHEVFRRL